MGTFVLEEAIGAGGMGAVFRAHDATLDRQVALKLLPPDQVDDPEVVQRFYQEGRSAARLDHENIARVYSLGQDGPFHYIVFEYVEGETIRRRVDEGGPMPVVEAVDVTLQIAQALVHAAIRGVVHRDVKPSNIIITPEGRAKLVDMGLARRFERRSERGGLTQTGMTLGTFDYISPEQARDPRDVDVRSDLYSLGCTLFHMLTGQPPFPGGTVLQKLLQHQEEEPPDVRELNPAVPPALAKVIDKLMAKDRDRRCQSPEQLVRDLLQVAGRAGLALPHFEVPAPQAARPSWERPLMLLTPLGFVLLAAGLFFWSRELADPSASAPVVEYGPLRAASRTPPALASAAGPAAPTAAAPRKIDVRPGEDLAAVIAAAPHKAVVTLTEDGPYLLGPAARATAPRSDAPRDVTIRAEAGRRPVLRFASDGRGGDRPAPSLLAFSRGRVAIEGLTFEAEDRALDDRVAAILLDDAELRLKGCTFRRPPDASAGPGLPAVRSRSARPDPSAGDRPPPVVAEQCHFDPGAVAIDCDGPADLQLVDCTFGPGAAALRLDDSDATSPGTRDVLLRRCSFMAGASPLFEVRGSQARFQVDDCVFAPADPVAPGRSLALVDAPKALAWSGRANLFGKFEGFLEVAGKPSSEDAVRDFDRWRSDLREVRSTIASSPVWEAPDAARELSLGREAPSRAFRLAAGYARSAPLGAGKGPFGAPIADASRASAASPAAAMTAAASEPPQVGPTAPNAASAAAEPAPRAADRPASNPSTADANATGTGSDMLPTPPPEVVASIDDEPPSIPTMPPMAKLDPDDEPRFEVTTAAPAAAAAIEPKAVAAPAATDRPRPRPEPPLGAAAEDVARSAEQLQNLIAHLGPGGGEVHVAAGVDLELSTIDLPPGSWTLRAEPGDRRPRLRFRPSPFGSPSASSWTCLFNVQGGELNLHGLDILVQDLDHQSMGRMAAVGLTAGAALEMTDCTVSLVGQAPAHAAVAVLPPKAAPAPAGPAVDPAVVRIRDAFVRTVGDAIAVSSNQRLDARLDNVVVAADGGLLHAQGCTTPSRETPSLSLRLDRALCRVKGGLVHLETSIDEVELPLAQVDARDSILSTGADGAPLFRVDGRGRADDLADRIRWTGEDVGYHEITIYRADDGGQTGVPPQRYARNDWLNNFVSRDDAAVIDVEFADRKAPSLPARLLSPESLRLAPRSPLARKGPDFAAIPAAPGAGS